MAIEFFRDSGRGFAPKASVRKQGQIGLNHGAVKRYELTEYTHAVLGFDKDASTIAIKLATDSEEAGSRPVVHKQGGATIAAKSFFDYFEIPYRDKTRTYEVTRNKDTGYLTILLGEVPVASNDTQEGNRPSE